MGRSTRRMTLSEQRKYRTLTAQQQLEPVGVARMAGVRQRAIDRTPKPRRPPQRRPPSGQVEEAIVEVAKANPSDGTRMVAALTSRRLGRPVNRKRAQRVMREQRLLQRHRPLRRRRRPGFFRVERPDQLWHLDLSSIWVAEHGWTYLNARDRLLYPRDRRLVARAALPRRGSDRSRRPRC